MAAPPPGSNPFIHPTGAVPGFPLTGVRPPLIPVGPPLMIPSTAPSFFQHLFKTFSYTVGSVPGLQPAPGGVSLDC